MSLPSRMETGRGVGTGTGVLMGGLADGPRLTLCSCPATSPSGAAGATTAPAAVGVGGRRSSEQPEAQNRSRQRNADLGNELHALHLFSLDPWGLVFQVSVTIRRGAASTVVQKLALHICAVGNDRPCCLR